MLKNGLWHFCVFRKLYSGGVLYPFDFFQKTNIKLCIANSIQTAVCVCAHASHNSCKVDAVNTAFALWYSLKDSLTLLQKS